MVSQFRETAAFLAEHGIPDAEFDARCIIEQVTGQKLETVRDISPAAAEQIQEMAVRRITGQPLQYILGEWEFFGMRLFVGEGVLIPRPDTEILVETVLEFCKNRRNPRILDLCTGSGCIALALQKHLPSAEVHALDISETALAYARKNAAYHKLPVKFHQADVREPQHFGKFDIIVSNPPYLTSDEMTQLQTEIQFEPALALAAGSDGLCFYRDITRLWKHALSSGGLLAFEIGEQQGNAVSGLLADQDFCGIRVMQDYAHHDRVVIGQVLNVS